MVMFVAFLFQGNPGLTLSIRLSNIGVIKAQTMALALSILVSLAHLPELSADTHLDGIDQQIVNSHATNQDVPILLWRKDNLGSGQNHTIRITVVDASCPNTCEIDRLV